MPIYYLDVEVRAFDPRDKLFEQTVEVGLIVRDRGHAQRGRAPAILITHFGLGGRSDPGSAANAAGPPGSLRVVAWPWAEIYIDGAHVETTPVARGFSLAPGIHEVELRNPAYRTEVRRVLIEPERAQKLVVTLRENTP